MTFEAILFYGFGALAVAFALAMVLNRRNTVAAALCLVVTMIALAGIYVLLEAYFIAVVQIMIYAGAVVVLFMFVVMLLNLRGEAFLPSRQKTLKLAGAGLGVVAVWALAHSLGTIRGALPPAAPLPEGFGGYRPVGLALFTDYVLAFELVSLLLLAAIVGAVVLAQRSRGRDA